jgi:hypothetical protein
MPYQAASTRPYSGRVLQKTRGAKGQTWLYIPAEDKTDFWPYLKPTAGSTRDCTATAKSAEIAGLYSACGDLTSAQKFSVRDF